MWSTPERRRGRRPLGSRSMELPRTGRGRYVVLEGGEGVGKSTQVLRLQKRLAAVEIEAVVLREPGGDPFGEAGRELLLSDVDRDPHAEVLLFNALRAQLLLTRVEPT